ncbi:MAG: hypothetical protein IPN94_27000 [Sphingobacteriales bacterium]|nr:hypothetical protein [Sphingobacteriales bacterium]
MPLAIFICEIPKDAARAKAPLVPVKVAQGLLGPPQVLLFIPVVATFMASQMGAPILITQDAAVALAAAQAST